ncbi:MAG TPA: lytic murein transglycosylase B [Gammaproteobacteria bacterium]|nr:lytic murein transglycosylase B [Gammaproteobacteria bacterium]
MMTKRILQAFCIAACLAAAAAPAGTGYKRYSDREEVRDFVDGLVEKHLFNRAELLGLFRRVEQQPSVLEAISRPAERVLTWSEYRPIFVTPDRIEGGVRFWRENKALLQEAEKSYGVPAQIIVAIIGVETRYGKQTGKYRVFDTLTTLGFEENQRQGFFRSELEHFLLLARDQRLDPLAVRGSYAGAMGMPQFISSSYREYAVDFNKDGRVDLWSNPDVIASVANYFKRWGWEQGAQVVVPAKVTGDVSEIAIGRGRKGLKPEKTYEVLRQAGVTAGVRLPPETEAVLIELETTEGLEYWLGLHNFYVITRYNGSAMYALAAYQLGQEIAVNYKKPVLADKSPKPVVADK